MFISCLRTQYREREQEYALLNGGVGTGPLQLFVSLWAISKSRFLEPKPIQFLVNNTVEKCRGERSV